MSYSNKHLEKVKEKTVQMFNSQKDLVDEAKRKIEESVRIQEGLQSYQDTVDLDGRPALVENFGTIPFTASWWLSGLW